MDIMRLLTRKLRAQSLDEKKATLFIRNAIQASDFDSGTASDDEIAELGKEPRLNDNDGGGDGYEEEENEEPEEDAETEMNFDVMQMAQVPWDQSRYCSNQLSTSFDNNDPLSTSSLESMLSTSPYGDCISPAYSGKVRPAAATPSGRLSAVSSDFERCSLDFEPSSSSEIDHHSSEEELTGIYHEERRKRTKTSVQNDQYNSGNELDAEFQDCDDDQQLPNLGHRNWADSISISRICSTGQATSNGFGSPRKRHRLMHVDSSAAVHRPSLDLYKMQKMSIIKRPNCVNCRPRVVKIRTINSSARPSKSNYDPSVFCFRSISWAPLKSKEEPFHAF